MTAGFVTSAHPADAVVAWLRVLRSGYCKLSALQLELLLLVARGIDTVGALAEAAGVDRKVAWRCVRILSGRGYLDRPGAPPVISSIRLLRATRHPHQQGQQLHLTVEAAALLSDAGLLGSEQIQPLGSERLEGGRSEQLPVVITPVAPAAS